MTVRILSFVALLVAVIALHSPPHALADVGDCG